MENLAYIYVVDSWSQARQAVRDRIRYDSQNIRSEIVNLVNMSISNFDWVKFFNRGTVKVLNLSWNHIKHIGYNDFQHFSALQKLDLSNNGLEFIDYIGFRHLN